MRVRILYHDRCFDGASSAALFSSFVKRSLAPGASIGFTGLSHQASQHFNEAAFDGDINAIVDFKYSPSSRVTWWFDHHQSAFLCAEDAEHFRADKSGTKFFGPDYRSCTKFIADTLSARFGFDASHLSVLIRWADLLDGALYESAEAAITMEHPAMKLNLVLESAPQSITADAIPLLASEPLAAIVERDEYARAFGALYQRHRENIRLIRDLAVCRRGVVFFDLIDSGLRGYNKFIPYYLYPESTYTVSVLDGGFRTKVSVGSNPWCPDVPEHNLADLCESFGGGGHPRVGAISYGPGQVRLARSTAAKIVETLSAG